MGLENLEVVATKCGGRHRIHRDRCVVAPVRRVARYSPGGTKHSSPFRPATTLVVESLPPPHSHQIARVHDKGFQWGGFARARPRLKHVMCDRPCTQSKSHPVRCVVMMETGCSSSERDQRLSVPGQAFVKRTMADGSVRNESLLSTSRCAGRFGLHHGDKSCK